MTRSVARPLCETATAELVVKVCSAVQWSVIVERLPRDALREARYKLRHLFASICRSPELSKQLNGSKMGMDAALFHCYIALFKGVLSPS